MCVGLDLDLDLDVKELQLRTVWKSNRGGLAEQPGRCGD